MNEREPTPVAGYTEEPLETLLWRTAMVGGSTVGVRPAPWAVSVALRLGARLSAHSYQKTAWRVSRRLQHANPELVKSPAPWSAVARAVRNGLDITVVESALGAALGEMALFADDRYGPADAGVRSDFTVPDRTAHRQSARPQRGPDHNRLAPEPFPQRLNQEVHRSWSFFRTCPASQQTPAPFP